MTGGGSSRHPFPLPVQTESTTGSLWTGRGRSPTRVRGAMGPVFAGLGSLAMVMVLYIGGRRHIDGELGLDHLVEMTQYLARLVWPTLALGWMPNDDLRDRDRHRVVGGEADDRPGRSTAARLGAACRSTGRARSPLPRSVR